MEISYLPYFNRKPDSQYRKLLETILERGEEVDTKTDEAAKRVIGYPMRFNLANGFPLIMERDLLTPSKSGSQFSQAIAELCAFLNGAQTLEEMEKFGCGWWKRWLTPEKCAKRGLPAGDNGPGSYGAVWRRFPTVEGAPFDQIQTLLEQIEELPHLRTLRVTNWIPQYVPRGKNRTQKVVVAPCHGDFTISINTRTREMTLTHIQRSADAPVGLVFNLIQYASLLLMLARATRYKPKALIYFIIDAHIYMHQIDAVQEILASEPKRVPTTKPYPQGEDLIDDAVWLRETLPGRLPTVTLNPDIKDLFAFRPEHFTVTDYHPHHERMTIWTPV